MLVISLQKLYACVCTLYSVYIHVVIDAILLVAIADQECNKDCKVEDFREVFIIGGDLFGKSVKSNLEILSHIHSGTLTLHEVLVNYIII